MIDRGAVIAGLEFTKAMVTFNPSTGEDIEPENLNGADKTTYDACVGAIDLLKEQEPVQLIYSEEYEEYWDIVKICPKCNAGWVSNEEAHFCPQCGQAVMEDICMVNSMKDKLTIAPHCGQAVKFGG